MIDDRKLMAFRDRDEWRAWLAAHHRDASEAWLVIRRKGVRDGALSLDEAVEEALCFGWIDGTLRSMDGQTYALRFSPRRATSIWSVRNLRRVERLIEEGRMTEAGLASVADARRSGQWDIAIARERTEEIPPDLARALRRRKGATAAYRALADSRKKQLLHWLFTAKRAETRQKRIAAIVSEVLG